MDYQNNITESCKNKRLNLKERMVIQIRLKDGYDHYRIAKELQYPVNTILNEM